MHRCMSQPIWHGISHCREWCSADRLDRAAAAARPGASGRLQLRDFLVKPIQRMCKYPLLLREVAKHAGKTQECGALPAGDAARAQAAMENAVGLVKHITDEVNEMQRLAERRSGEKLLALANMVVVSLL